jgi:hypothetical protein
VECKQSKGAEEVPDMKEKLIDRGPRRDFGKRAEQILAELQKELLPEHASDFIGIDVDTRQYVLGPDSDEVVKEFRRRWPGKLVYLARVDGGPVIKFHGFVPV